jgi:hypothetical protein
MSKPAKKPKVVVVHPDAAYLKREEAATLIGVSARTLDKYVAAKRLRPHYASKRLALFDRQAVLALVAAMPATPPA